MQRFFLCLIVWLLWVPATPVWAASPTAAQTAEAQRDLRLIAHPSPLAWRQLSPTTQLTTTVRAPLRVLTVTTPVTTTTTITPSALLTETALTDTETITASLQPITPTTAAPERSTTVDSPLQGTILANRTQAQVRFFVEGQTYDLPALRSQGVALPRATAVLNLFNCDANTSQTQEGCFWDPYLINRDGFYEVVSGQEEGKAVSLVLREASAPPVNQIWVQNRAGSTELIFFNNQQYELPPASVQEFTGQPDSPITLYLRSCLEVAARTVCEWYPQSVETGVYYGLTEITTAGGVPGSRLNLLQLQPIVSAASEDSPVVESAPPQLVCTLAVPAINVRSGPGLEYQIVAKVRGTETEPGTVLVVGRDAAGQWLAVDERVAQGGWITGSSNFVTCGGDTTALPVAEVTDGRLSLTPVAAAGDPGAGGPASSDSTTTAETVAAPTATAPLTTTIPDGQALLIINNGFDQVVRFTLDQQFRVEQGPSEFDLQPGQSMTFFVRPGVVAFTASTPWRGLSGNADFFIDNRQSRTLWLIFVPDPDGSGRWILQY
jgi:hypothetical protein